MTIKAVDLCACACEAARFKIPPHKRIKYWYTTGRQDDNIILLASLLCILVSTAIWTALYTHAGVGGRFCFADGYLSARRVLKCLREPCKKKQYTHTV